MQLTSKVFAIGEMIPAHYTCDGKDMSPPLAWSGVPETTAALVLLCEDPDAPGGDWTHWLMFNIPATETSLAAGVRPDPVLANGAAHGKNSWGKLGYGGPCPPGGRHRYFFKLHALDLSLPLKPGASKSEVLAAMQGHVLKECQLMGTYERR